MSIGGTVALTLSDYLSKTNSPIKPNGVFVVDSPIDLYALYESSQLVLRILISQNLKNLSSVG